MVKSVDTKDLKSFDRKVVRVQVSFWGLSHPESQNSFSRVCFHAILWSGRTPSRTGACPRREAGGTSGNFLCKGLSWLYCRYISMKAVILIFQTGRILQSWTACSFVNSEAITHRQCLFLCIIHPEVKSSSEERSQSLLPYSQDDLDF